MIHADEIEEVLDEQVSLTDAATREGIDPLTSYFANMGICPDCFLAIATMYCTENRGLNLANLATFIRGFSVGLVLGRQYPTVEGA